MSAVVPLVTGIRRALAAQAVSAVGDVPLAGVCAGALLLSASIAANVPADIAAAPDDVKALVAAPLATVLAVYAAVLAAIYGSFRYTVDRRAGVVAQRSTAQPRPWALVARPPFTALGGVLVAAASIVGGRLALAPTLGGIGLDAGTVAAALAVGAVAALWGLGVGLLVQAHLPSLFVAPLSLSGALLAAPLWPDVVGWLPLPALLSAAGLDLGALGLDGGVGPAPGIAPAIAGAWVVAILAAGGWSFLHRDLG
ncbi:hypothetical protein [Microbacterium enclense]|uniref:hypothetical protein n=1 Tax=Microbacterium enclense TaxID=993073 RepID=UPI003D72CD56